MLSERSVAAVLHSAGPLCFPTVRTLIIFLTFLPHSSSSFLPLNARTWRMQGQNMIGWFNAGGLDMQIHEVLGLVYTLKNCWFINLLPFSLN